MRSDNLTAIVQSQLRTQQTPPADSCEKKRLLTCDLSKACGFGCIGHHLIMCLFMAHGTNRTLALDFKKFYYNAEEGWNSTKWVQTGGSLRGGNDV